MAKTNDNIINLTLSDDTKVEFNPDKATGHVLFKAREASNGDFRTTIFMIAEIATFNGEKLCGEEILNKSAFDILALEKAWSICAPKCLQ